MILKEFIDHEGLLISVENENFLNNEILMVMALDNHKRHIENHLNFMRNNILNEVEIKRGFEHIDEHVKMLKELDPKLVKLGEGFFNDVLEFYKEKKK